MYHCELEYMFKYFNLYITMCIYNTLVNNMCKKKKRNEIHL